MKKSKAGAAVTPFTWPEIDTTLATVERWHIERALAYCESRSAAAQLLGIDRRTLYRMIERHGIKPGMKPEAAQ